MRRVFVLDCGDLALDVFTGRVEMGSRRQVVWILLRQAALLKRVDLVEEYVGRRKLHLS